MTGWGSAACSVCGGWVVWVVLRLVWKRQRVVGVALQGSDAVVMRTAQGVADGMGEQRVRADLHEGRVLGAGRGDGLAEPHRVTQVGRPVVGIENDCAAYGVVTGGGDDRDPRRLRRQVGKRRPQLGQYRIDDRMMGGHVHLDAPRQPVLGVHHRDHRIDLLGRPGDHRLARRGIHRHGDLGVVGDQRRGGLPRPAPAAPSRPARPAATSAASGWRSPAARRPGSAPRPPPPRSPRPSNARSPHPGATP